MNDGTLRSALEALKKLELIEETHYKTVYQAEGKDAYRRSLVTSFMYKFFVHLMPSAPAAIATAAQLHERPVSTGKQTFSTVLPEGHPGRKPMPKIEAKEQASGEATFHDDEGNGSCLFAAFVPCTRAPAYVVAIDPSQALAMEGVVAFLGADDIPGGNTVAFAAPGQEELLVAVGDSGAGTSYVGQPVGIIVARSRREAEAATMAVEVTYNVPEDMVGVYSLEDAIEKESYQPSYAATGGCNEKVKGDPDDMFSKIEGRGGTIISGEFKIGGQSHFAMEKNTCLAIPQ